MKKDVRNVRKKNPRGPGRGCGQLQLLAQSHKSLQNLTSLLYLGANELLKKFGETLDRFHQSVQDSFGFSFSVS